MKRLLAVSLVCTLAAPASAASFKLERSTIDGGGGHSASARFAVTGTIGQPDADPLQPSTSANGRFAVTGGFWRPAGGGGSSLSRIFRNGFED